MLLRRVLVTSRRSTCSILACAPRRRPLVLPRTLHVAMDAPPTLDEDLELLMNKVSGWEKKIPDIAKYRASIRIPETVKGDVGGVEQPEPRYVQRSSPLGQAIVAARLKRERETAVLAMETEPVLEAAAPVQPEAAPVVVAAPAPAATVEVTDDNRQFMAGVAARQELAVLERNFWNALVRSGLTRWQDMAADWDGSKACPPFDIVSPKLGKPSRNTFCFYEGHVPELGDREDGRGKKAMTWDDCTTDKMKADWAVAKAFSRLAGKLYKAEQEAYRKMLQLSKANGFNGGTRGGEERVRYGDENAYAPLVREVVEKLILDDKKTYYHNSHSSLRDQVAKCDDILDALAAPFEDLDKSALVKVGKQGRRRFVSPVAPSDLPCFKGQLRKTNLDHVDGGWGHAVRAVRKLLVRRLCDAKFNQQLSGIEYYLDPKNAAVRAYIDAYIPSALCHDPRGRPVFRFKFEVDPITWHRMSRAEQQELELYHIRGKLLKGAMSALSDDEVELEGLDAVRLALLQERYPGLTFKRATSFVKHGCGRFSAQFLDRGVVEMVIDHIGLATEKGKDGKWYREVGFRGLLPEDENRYASGYEWMTILGLEEYCRDYLANPLYKTGYKTDHGEVVAAAFAKKYGPDPFQWNL